MNSISKAQVASIVSAYTGYSQWTVERIIDEFLNTVVSLVRSGRVVKLQGFGKFEKKHRAPRVGNNPHTNKRVPIPERDRFTFTPSESIVDM